MKYPIIFIISNIISAFCGYGIYSIFFVIEKDEISKANLAVKFAPPINDNNSFSALRQSNSINNNANNSFPYQNLNNNENIVNNSLAKLSPLERNKILSCLSHQENNSVLFDLALDENNQNLDLRKQTILSLSDAWKANPEKLNKLLKSSNPDIRAMSVVGAYSLPEYERKQFALSSVANFYQESDSNVVVNTLRLLEESKGKEVDYSAVINVLRNNPINKQVYSSEELDNYVCSLEKGIQEQIPYKCKNA